MLFHFNLEDHMFLVRWRNLGILLSAAFVLGTALIGNAQERSDTAASDPFVVLRCERQGEDYAFV